MDGGWYACPYPLRPDEPWMNIWSWFHGALLRILLTDDAFQFCIFSCACNCGMEMEECCQRWRITFSFFFFLRDILILIQIFLSEFLHAKNMHAKSKIKILKIWDRNIENIRHIYNYISLLPILINNNKLFPNLKETKIFS